VAVSVGDIAAAALVPTLGPADAFLLLHHEEPATEVHDVGGDATEVPATPERADERHEVSSADQVQPVPPPAPEPEPELEPEPAVLPGADVADPLVTWLGRPEVAEPSDAGVPDLSAPIAFPPPTAYDDIYGATVARSVQQAAVVNDESSDGLISSIPSENGPAIQLGDHDGRTITKAQLSALRGVGAGAAIVAPAAAGGQVVQAVLCPSSHPNPPSLAQCRVCGVRVLPAVVNVVRPPLGVLRFSTGREVRLDRSLLVGRNPKVSGMVGGELPEVVIIDDGAGLSRTHLAIRLESWQILAEDLNSANGTIVTLLGQPPRRLHPGEPCVLEPGAQVDLGGEISFRLDVG